MLQLKWTHAFQFAGYYLAVERGYYREAGLDVSIVEGTGSLNPVTEVLAGRAQFGIGTSSLLLERVAGKPVVVLGVLQQHSPQVLLALEQKWTQSVHDFAGSRLMIEPQAEELLIYLQREGLQVVPEMLRPHEGNLDALLAGRARAMSAYSSYEPYFLRQLGIPYHLYTPRAAGIDFYGDNLFTSAAELARRPELVEAFRAASMRGWQEAVADPEAAIALIQAQYAPGLTIDFLRFEANELLALMHADVVQVGYMSEGRWQHIANTYAEFGLLPEASLPDGFIYQSKLDQTKLRRLQRLLALGAVAAVLALLLFFYMYSLIHRLRRARAELKNSEWRYRMLAEQMSDIIWVIDLELERFTFISPSVERVRGISPAEVMAGHFSSFARPEDTDRFGAWLKLAQQRFAAGEIDESWHEVIESQVVRADGARIYLEAVCHFVRNPRNGHLEVHGVSRDITERRRQEKMIRHLAQHDSLTGLPNRALFSRQIEHSLAWARREHGRLALIFLDLDHFKPVNDAHGHFVGDQLLCQVAQRMRTSLREVDLVARLGGDEFVILLHDIPSADAARGVAEKLRLALREVFLVDGLVLQISCSQGIALYPEHGGTEHQLARHADVAMYAAKRTGRDAVFVYAPELEEMSSATPAQAAG